jgi:O-antigen/teichoic acid export membrane protein
MSDFLQQVPALPIESAPLSKDKRLTERTFSGFLFLITGSGIQVVLKVGVLAVLARLVSPQEFGLVGVAVIVVEFSKMFTQMGVGPAIVQRQELEDRHLTTGFTISLAMGLFFAAGLLLSAPLIATFFKMEGLTPVLRAISCIFLIDSFTLIAQALMQREMKFKTIAAIEVSSYAIGFGIAGIFLAYIGWGVWALVTAHLLQAVLNVIFLVITQPFPKRPGFEKKAFLELLTFGGGMTMARVGNFLATQGDNLIVGRMLGAAALGIYGRAYQFMVMPAGLFGNALDKSLFPAMAKVQDDKERLGRAYLTGVSLIALISIPLSIEFVLMAPEIVLTLLGAKWADVILPFQVLACSLLFRMSYKMSDSLARATGAVYKRAWRQVLYAVLVVVGSYIGQFWGLTGVAWGVAITLVLNFLMMAHLSISLTGIHWLEMVKVHLHGILLGVITGSLSYFLVTACRTYFHSPMLTLFLNAAATVLTVLILLKYLPTLIISDDLKSLFGKLITQKFKKHLSPEKI